MRAGAHRSHGGLARGNSFAGRRVAQAATHPAGRRGRRQDLPGRLQRGAQDVVVTCKHTGNALESVVRMMNQVVSIGDMFGTWEEESARLERARGYDESEPGKAPVPVSPEEARKAQEERRKKSKWVTFRANGSSKIKVSEDPAMLEAGRGVAAYMSLPPEEYSLLDPKYILREEGMDGEGAGGAGNGGDRETEFCLRVPVKELTGLNLNTKVWVGVEVLERRQQVVVQCRRATLGARDPTMDERFTVQMRSDLRWRSARRWGLGWESPGEDQGPRGGEEAAGASHEAGHGGEGPGEQEWVLSCSSNVCVTVHVPPPLAAIPGPLLGGAGSIVLKAVANGILPQFLGLLSSDYKRWAEGTADRSDAVGSLLPSSPPDPLVGGAVDVSANGGDQIAAVVGAGGVLEGGAGGGAEDAPADVVAADAKQVGEGGSDEAAGAQPSAAAEIVVELSPADVESPSSDGRA